MSEKGGGGGGCVVVVVLGGGGDGSWGVWRLDLMFGLVQEEWAREGVQEVERSGRLLAQRARASVDDLTRGSKAGSNLRRRRLRLCVCCGEDGMMMMMIEATRWS